MTIPLLTDSAYNLSQGLPVIFIYLNFITDGLFMKMLLTSVWVIIAFSSFFFSKKAVGTGDIPVSISVASFITLIFAFILRLQSGLIDNISMAVLVVLALIGIAMIMFDDETG